MPRRRTRGLGAVDALIDASAVPELHRELVRRVVREARLPKSATMDVAGELLSHFEDGLAHGVGAELLVAQFGCATRAAELIRRAQRRRRHSIPWRRRTRLAIATSAVSLTAAYVTSAVALHGADPLMATASAIASSRDATSTPAWIRGADKASASRERVRARFRDADARTRREAIVESLDDAAALRRDHTLESDLAAIDIIRDALLQLGDSAIDPAVDAALSRALAPDGVLLRAAVVRAGYRDLLDRVYSGKAGDARVTARGLRVLQALRGKSRPGFAAIVLEPAYFARPARRGEIEAEIDVIAADVEGAGRALSDGGVARLQARQASLDSEPLRALRYYPIAVTLPRLAEAAGRAEDAVRAIETARRFGRLAGTPGAPPKTRD
jgi:hypothetical protein